MKDLDSLVLYLFVSMVVGARLGHVFFYNWDYFSSNPLEIFQIWNGGLASHGAAIGLLLFYWIWTMLHKQKFSKYVDALVMGIPVTGIFVRIGNFFNSEIIGIPTNGEWGIIYERLNETVARHPVQIYESFGALVIAAIMFWIYKRKGFKKVPKLFYMFLLILLYFAMRFVAEFWKERHIIPSEFPVSMGQILSIIPFVIALSYFLFFFPKMRQKAHAKNK